MVGAAGHIANKTVVCTTGLLECADGEEVKMLDDHCVQLSRKGVNRTIGRHLRLLKGFDRGWRISIL